jgi:hypothetical protein
MKKIMIGILIIGLIFIFTSQILAFENMTAARWNNLKEEEKVKYLEGIFFGMNFFMISMHSSFEENIDMDLMAEQLKREGELIQPDSDDYNDTVNKIDNYFKKNPDKEMFDLWMTNTIE